jgi:DNA polymerase II large subunit
VKIELSTTNGAQVLKGRLPFPHKIAVECLECGKKFSTASMLPSCPKCGGSDIELAS